MTLSDTTSGFTNPYQYTGREADSAGLYYYRARYYSPVMGGFVSEDPITFGGGQLSFYAYVNGNPLMYVDSIGMKPGDPFPSARGAAIDVLNYVNPLSISGNKEYGGLIYKSGNCYYATLPAKGGGDHVRNFYEGRQRMPEGSFPVGDYHTHGAYSIKGANDGDPFAISDSSLDEFNSDHFSEKDMINSAKAAGIIDGWESYLGTPSGKFFYYDPHVGEQLPLK